MERNTFEMHWSYYLSIEDMLQKTNQYLTYSANNQNTYSDEFTKVILLSCSEVDSLLKKLCEYKNISKKGKYYTMASYAIALQESDELIAYTD